MMFRTLLCILTIKLITDDLTLMSMSFLSESPSSSSSSLTASIFVLSLDHSESSKRIGYVRSIKGGRKFDSIQQEKKRVEKQSDIFFCSIMDTFSRRQLERQCDNIDVRKWCVNICNNNSSGQIPTTRSPTEGEGNSPLSFASSNNNNNGQNPSTRSPTEEEPDINNNGQDATTKSPTEGEETSTSGSTTSGPTEGEKTSSVTSTCKDSTEIFIYLSTFYYCDDLQRKRKRLVKKACAGAAGKICLFTCDKC